MDYKSKLNYQKLKLLTRKKDLSFEGLALAVGIKRPTMYRLLSDPNPGYGYIEAVAEFFGLTPTDIMTKDKKKWKENC